MEQPTDEFVRNARAVATITGFIGWEALLRGVPALVFGAAWYRACRGIYRIKTRQDVDAALASIAAGQRHKVEEVVAYAGALEDSGQICYSNTSLAGGAAVERSEQISALTQLLLDFEERSVEHA